MYPAYGFWPSKLNRADAPTRDSAVEGPDLDKPTWLRDLEAENYVDFEQWLSGVGKLDFPQADDFSELGYKGSFDLRPGSSLKSKEQWSERLAIQKPGVKLEVSDEYPAEIRVTLASFHSRQFIVRKGCKKIAGAGAVGLYSGVAAVARSLVRGGCPWVLTFEILRHSSENLLDGALQQKLLVLIRSDYVSLVGSAIVCRSFSVAVTPPVKKFVVFHWRAGPFNL